MGEVKRGIGGVPVSTYHYRGRRILVKEFGKVFKKQFIVMIRTVYRAYFNGDPFYSKHKT
jgi:hypothetical protein